MDFMKIINQNFTLIILIFAEFFSVTSSFAQTQQNIEILSFNEIKTTGMPYKAWPTIAKINGNKIAITYSSRLSHIDPLGRVEVIQSDIDLKNWSAPSIAIDTELDDRDSGLVSTNNGTIILTSFSSRAFENFYKKASVDCNLPRRQSFENNIVTSACLNIEKWDRQIEKIKNTRPSPEVESYLIRSENNGKSWGEKIKVPVSAPHGPVNLTNGNLLYAGRSYPTSENTKIKIYSSSDEGLTWESKSSIENRPEDKASLYFEPHVVQCTNETLVLHLRNENIINNKEILQSVSNDNGKTWEIPRPIGSVGFPPHLIKTKKNSLLLTYARRSFPQQIVARESFDCGKKWSDEIVINSIKNSTDFGYPSTIEIKPGLYATAWYAANQDASRSELFLIQWRQANK
jgi:hypothetical protein